MSQGHSDYRPEWRDVDVKLLRGLALGGHRSVEIQLLLDSVGAGGQANDHQSLALLLAGESVASESARFTFEQLAEHQTRMSASLLRNVGIKTAALDLVEQIERALNIRDDEHSLTYRQLAQLAFSDHLTGLANFRYFEQRFHEEIKRADRYRKLLSLLLVDLDHFKRFNDTHGHPAGNKALEHLAEQLRQNAREIDLVARFGGEEFAILLPETSKHEAGVLAERIRQTVETGRIDLGTEKLRVTVSIGFATFPRDAHTAPELLQHADQALYRAKEFGRNRVAAFEPPSTFTFHFRPDQSYGASLVHVVGDFNGWSPNVDALRHDSDGAMRLMLRLSPGVYEYKFVLNGSRYIPDPANPQTVSDGFGGLNSVAVVK